MDERAAQDEIAALKARLNRLEGGPKPSVPGARPPKAKRPFLSAVLIAVAVIAGLAWISSQSGFSNPPDPATPTPSAVCNKPWAAEVVQTAQRGRLISGIDMSAGQGVIVVVRQGPWEVLTLNQQKVVAAAIDCHVAGPDYLTAISFRLSRDGPSLYRLTYTDLYELRQAGAAAN